MRISFACRVSSAPLQRDRLAHQRIGHLRSEGVDDRAGAALGVIHLLPERNAAQSRERGRIEIGPRQRRGIVEFVRLDELPAEQFLVGFRSSLDRHWHAPGLGVRAGAGNRRAELLLISLQIRMSRWTKRPTGSRKAMCQAMGGALGVCASRGSASGRPGERLPIERRSSTTDGNGTPKATVSTSRGTCASVTQSGQ